MSMRLATFTAFALVSATPALADCREELTKLEQAAVTAETGAATNESGMPVTKHQEQLLTGNQGGASSETTGSVTTTTPHQQQVTGLPKHGTEQIATKMTEARQMADTGNETGCMQKVTELKALMGLK